MKKGMPAAILSVLFLVSANILTFAICSSVRAEDKRKSARPRMIEVEEETWIKLNQDLLKTQDELMKAKLDLKVSGAELESLKKQIKDYAKIASVHRVRKNDCLWKIAQKYYKDPFKWRWIYKANIKQIDDPDMIYPEQILDIPKY